VQFSFRWSFTFFVKKKLEEIIKELLNLQITTGNDMAEAELKAIKEELRVLKETLSKSGIEIPGETKAISFPQPKTIDEFKSYVDKDIKNMPCFTGEGYPTLNEWIRDVDPLVENLYRLMAKSPDLHYYMREIRRKITGQAGMTLANYGIPLDWKSIKKSLIENFSDKRSLTILEMEALSMRQNSEPLEAYYSKSNELLTKTVEALKLSAEIDENSVASHLKQAQNRVLTCFVNGLNQRYEATCRAMRPKTLAEAYNMCLEIRNAARIKNMTATSGQYKNAEQKKKQNYIGNAFPKRTSIEKWEPVSVRFQNFEEAQNFKLKPFEQPMSTQTPALFQGHQTSAASEVNRKKQSVYSRQNPVQPPRPPKPNFQKVEPMDVDPSIQTKNIDYQNFQSKRPPSKVNGNIPKYQKLYYLEEQPIDENQTEEDEDETFVDAEEGDLDELEVNFLG
jgi:hypothetical protein